MTELEQLDNDYVSAKLKVVNDNIMLLEAALDELKQKRESLAIDFDKSAPKLTSTVVMKIVEISEDIEQKNKANYVLSSIILDKPFNQAEFDKGMRKVRQSLNGI